MRLSHLCFITILPLMTACYHNNAYNNHHSQDDVTHQHPRIAERNLKTEHHQTLTPLAQAIDALHIEFDNESSALSHQAEVALTQLTERYAEHPLLVMGHSHGGSAVGNQALATQRLKVVSHTLKAQGIDHLQLQEISFGSQKNFGLMPYQGVQIFVLDKHS